MNERLRRALDQADFDVDGIARATGVSQRTVERWIAGRAPRPRYRRAIARLMRRDEAFLWPKLASPGAARATAEILMDDVEALPPVPVRRRPRTIDHGDPRR